MGVAGLSQLRLEDKQRFLAAYSNFILSILFALSHAKEVYLLCHLCSFSFHVSHSLLVRSLKTLEKPLQVAHYSDIFFGPFFIFKFIIPQCSKHCTKKQGKEIFVLFFLQKCFYQSSSNETKEDRNPNLPRSTIYPNYIH